MSSKDSELKWHRTSPVAVVFFLFRTVRQLAFNGLPAIVVMVAAFGSGGSGRKALMLFGLLALLAAGVIGSILSWLRFRFSMAEGRVLVRSGVFHREELSVGFDRIQNVKIQEPFYMRPFGLAVLGIDTAGSSQKEIMLGGIDRDQALRFREAVLSMARTEPEDGNAETEDPSGQRALLSRSVKDIVIYGLTINFIVWVAVALGAFFSAGESTEKFFSWAAERVQLDDVIMAVQVGGSFLGNLLLVSGMVLAVILLLPLVSVLGALFRHYGYRLTADDETYVRSSGLLTRHEESMKRHKIQAVVLRQNFIARFFSRTNMQLRVASAGSGVENGQMPTGARATFLIPVLRPSELSKFGEEFFPGCEIDAPGYSRVDRRRLTGIVLGVVALCTLPVTGVLGFLVSWKFLAIPLLVLLIAWLVVNRYWKNSGYAVVGEYGFVRHGFVGSRTTVFPLFKVQRIDIRQSPGQRRRGLANLSIHLASHSLTVTHMDAADAQKIRDLALFYVESSNRAWY